MDAATAAAAPSPAAAVAAPPPAATTTAAAASSAGVGSVWNPGSFFFEERDHGPFARALLSAALGALPPAVSADGLLRVAVTGPPTTLALTAATVVRRGRKMLLWEVASLALPWSGGAAAAGQVDRSVTGTLTLEPGGIQQDDAGGDFPVRLGAVKAHVDGGRREAPPTTRFDTALAQLAAEALVPRLRQTVRMWAAALAAHDDGLDTAARAAREAEAARAPAVAASVPVPVPVPVAAPVAASSSSAAALPVDAVSDGLGRMAVSSSSGGGGGGSSSSGSSSVGSGAPSAAGAGGAAAAVQPAPDAPALPAAVPAATASGKLVDDRPSAWNAGSGLWEERDITAWARGRLSELVGGLDLDVSGGTVRIVEVKLKGDASVALRRSKKIVLFEFAISARWEGELLGPGGQVLASGDGKVAVPDVDQDSAGSGDYAIDVTVDDDADAGDVRLRELFARDGAPALRRVIDRFFADVMARV